MIEIFYFFFECVIRSEISFKVVLYLLLGLKD